MKFEVYKQKEAPKDETIRFQLRMTGSTVELIAVDEWGERLDQGAILGIRNDGKLVRYFGMRIPGFATDSEGRILEKG